MRRAVPIAVALAMAALPGCGGGRDARTATPPADPPPAATVPQDELQAQADEEAQGAAANAQANQDTDTTTPTTTTAPETTTTTKTPPARTSPLRPAIVTRFIPFPQQRKDEMAAYSQRHYGDASDRLRNPKVIVQHITVNTSLEATYNTFAPDRPDAELGELPGTCAHFVVDRDGTIVQLVPLSLRCRHTVGLNWTAIGVEHVGLSTADVLRNDRQMQASLELSTWLRCRYDIALRDVIGHNESRESPYHRENVARLRTQTHADWTRAEMDLYRRKLRARPCA